MKSFGEYVKMLRLERQISLREFCRTVNVDTSNWSKVERGLLPPTKSKEILESIRQALSLAENSDEYQTIKELAVISHMPTELLDNQTVVNKLPLFFRTLRGDKPMESELDNLIRLLKE